MEGACLRWVFWKRVGGGTTLPAPSEDAGWEKADRACLALKILHGINCVPLIHSDGRSGDASFRISPCTHASH